MSLLVLFLVLFVLMIVGLMPGSHNQRDWLLAIVLGAFIVFTSVYHLIITREQARNAKLAARKHNELKSPRERRNDLRDLRNLRRRRLGSSRGHSRSRVLEFGSGLGSGKPRIRQASLRRQDELRVRQGMRDAAEERADAMRHRGARVRSDEEDPIGRRHLERLSRSHSRKSSSRPVSQAGSRRQEELRIEQGRSYAAESGESARLITETVGERRKRDRLRRRRERFWRETDWGCSV